MRSIMDAVRAVIVSGPAVYVHCLGGIGRTGTVVGCWLQECGLGPDEALERNQELYSTHMPKANAGKKPESPQTPAQKQTLRRWIGGECLSAHVVKALPSKLAS